MRLKRLSSLLLGLVLILVQVYFLLGGRWAAGGVVAAEAAPGWEEQAPVGVDVNCRYGLAALSTQQVDKVSLFKAGWYLNFNVSIPGGGGPSSSEYVPIIRVKQNKDAQGNYLPGYYSEPPEVYIHFHVDDRPGALWIIGNEIDRGPDPGQIQGGQGDIYPEVYAEAYHNIYHLIKSLDPTAQVAPSALVQVTPGRLQYLDHLWEAYLERYGTPMPVDVWNMHLYILPEVQPNGLPNGIASVALGTDLALAISENYDPDGSGPLTPRDSCPLAEVYCWAEHDNMTLFKEQIVGMRVWMKEHGQQNKPLILSEFSILYPYYIDQGGTCYLTDEFGGCFTPERVSDFAANSLNYLQHEAIDTSLGYPADNYRLVQQWLWFSIWNTGVGDASNLLEGDLTTLTLAGATFKNFVEAQPLVNNLMPVLAYATPVFSGPPNGTADATLVVRLVNNGNDKTIPFTVTFYEDEALTLPIGSAEIQQANGCGRKEYRVATTWHGLPAGLHTFWARVDSQDVVGESNEGDNVISGLVMVDPYQQLLPLIRR